MNNAGKVYLVGAGCGDFDLITLRGKRLLEICQVIVYDSLIDDRLLEFVPSDCEKICVGKRAGRHSESQENINSLLVQKAGEGKNVVRLKGGDPFVFGRGGEEITALRQNSIPYSIVPGISSCIACAELGGIPVTHRNVSRSFHVITGHTAEDLLPENMKNYAQLDGTLVFLMGLGNVRNIAESLISNGKAPKIPAAVISNGAGANQSVLRTTLDNIADKTEKSGIKPPAVIVIGETAGYDFSPTIFQPLKGVSVAVTGTKRLTDKLTEKFAELGACVKNVCRMKPLEYKDNNDFDNALKHLDSYNIIVLTSMNGAHIFLDKLKKLRIDLRKLCGIRFAVIGSGTSEVLEQNGIFPDIIPKKFTSECLGKAVAKNVSGEEKVLILRAKQGSVQLTDILDKNSILYDDIKTYDVFGDNCGRQNVCTDFVIFASPSGVREFFKHGNTVSDKTQIVSIGEVTAEALKSFGKNDFIICKTQNVDGIVSTVLMEAKQNEKIQTTESQ